MKIEFVNEKKMEDCVCEYLMDRIEEINRKDSYFFTEVNQNSTVYRQVGLLDYGIADVVVVTPYMNKKKIVITLIELKNDTAKAKDFEQISRYVKGIEKTCDELEGIKTEIRPILLCTNDPHFFMCDTLLSKGDIELATIEIDSKSGIKIVRHLNNYDWYYPKADMKETSFYETLIGLKE